MSEGRTPDYEGVDEAPAVPEAPEGSVEIRLEDLSVLPLEPHDIILVRLPGSVYEHDIVRAREHVKKHLPGHEVLVIPADVELAVVRPPRVRVMCGATIEGLTGTFIKCVLEEGHPGGFPERHETGEPGTYFTLHEKGALDHLADVLPASLDDGLEPIDENAAWIPRQHYDAMLSEFNRLRAENAAFARAPHPDDTYMRGLAEARIEADGEWQPLIAELQAQVETLRSQLAVHTDSTEWGAPATEWTWGFRCTDGPGLFIGDGSSEAKARAFVESGRETSPGWKKAVLCRNVSAWREADAPAEIAGDVDG